MRLLGLDFETTGLSPENDVVTEVGVVLWDTDRKCPILIDNYFVNDGNPVISSLITRLTGIRQEDIVEFGLSSEEALMRLIGHINKAEAIVAHNGERFDRKFFNAWCGRACSDAAEIKDVPWIDTLSDVDYPENCASKKLTYLAVEHGFLNPFAHRAVFDVLTMMRILDHYPIDDILESMKEPTILVEAIVSFMEKDLAKERSFKWDGTRKKWLRSMKKNKWEKEEFPFDTRMVS